MSRIDDVMEADDSAEPSNAASSGDRLGSIMEDDYDRSESEPEDPKETGIIDEPIPSSEKPKEEEKKEEKDTKEKKDKKEKDDKEEKKKEEVAAEKKKIKYKVDGEEIEEEVTDQDLINDFSGRKAIQKRFNEIDKAKKELAKNQEEYKADHDFVRNEFKSVRDSFEMAIGDFVKTGQVKGNPVDGIYNLLDKMGLDSKEYDKLLFSHYIPEVARFLDMDDTGREAFMLKKENEWFKKGQSKLEEKNRQTADYQQKLTEENSLKRQAGISEEQFNELKDELENKFELKGLKTDQIIQWAKEKPAYTRAESIAEKVPGIDIVKVARILLEFPETTDEWMLEQLGYKKILESKAMEDLKGKIPPKPQAKKVANDTEEDDEFFKQFRRR